MATTPAGGTRATPQAPPEYDYPAQGGGWVLFAGIMLMMVGVLNVIWGIAAIDQAQFFVQDTKYIFSDLKTWGWIGLIVGILQVLAAGSLWAGGLYGRIVGIGAASLSAIAALLSIPGYPFWSLAIFALDVVIIHQIATRGTEGRGAEAQAGSATARDMEGMAQYKQ
jgi:hypothetical protein